MKLQDLKKADTRTVMVQSTIDTYLGDDIEVRLVKQSLGTKDVCFVDVNNYKHGFNMMKMVDTHNQASLERVVDAMLADCVTNAMERDSLVSRAAKVMRKSFKDAELGLCEYSNERIAVMLAEV